MMTQFRKQVVAAFFVAALLVVFPCGLQAAALHAILVADTGASDIGKSTAIDFSAMRKEMQKIACYTGLQLKETLIKGDDAEPQNVWQALGELTVEGDDVIFFYFAGHGYRTARDQESPWPNLYFSRTNSGVSYERVGKKLEALQPRLLIVFADACNNVIPEICAPPLVRALAYLKDTKEKAVEKNYCRLFLEPAGVIMATSSKAGEYAWETEQGGLFTRAFLNSLKNEVEFSATASWLSLFEDAAAAVARIEERQHPDYRLFVDTD